MNLHVEELRNFATTMKSKFDRIRVATETTFKTKGLYVQSFEDILTGEDALSAVKQP